MLKKIGLLEKMKTITFSFKIISILSCYIRIQNPTKDMIMKAASFCKLYTKYRNLPNIKINYTIINNVKKADKVGSVTFNSNRKVQDIKI